MKSKTKKISTVRKFSNKYKFKYLMPLIYGIIAYNMSSMYFIDKAVNDYEFHYTLATSIAVSVIGHLLGKKKDWTYKTLISPMLLSVYYGLMWLFIYKVFDIEIVSGELIVIPICILCANFLSCLVVDMTLESDNDDISGGTGGGFNSGFIIGSGL